MGPLFHLMSSGNRDSITTRGARPGRLRRAAALAWYSVIGHGVQLVLGALNPGSLDADQLDVSAPFEFPVASDTEVRARLYLKPSRVETFSAVARAGGGGAYAPGVLSRTSAGHPFWTPSSWWRTAGVHEELFVSEEVVPLATYGRWQRLVLESDAGRRVFEIPTASCSEWLNR